MRRIGVPLVLLMLAVPLFATQKGSLILGGERIRFDENLVPQFTASQIENTNEATRVGLLRWAATARGQQMIAYFLENEFELTVIEDASEPGIGRAPQPGLATLVAAAHHTHIRNYELVLNPRFFKIPDGMVPLPNQASTPADMMSIAWAGEMLHIYFYTLGISLPHHARADFQREWREIAVELGMPTVTHDDGDERPRGRSWRSSHPAGDRRP
ncbi:MAG TPA: hypothetical protein VLV78_17465 [Thermoanaerobaculia bacterium]|nr:hypothetical protein [Thermoanaerobaculia bacterium]